MLHDWILFRTGLKNFNGDYQPSRRYNSPEPGLGPMVVGLLSLVEREFLYQALNSVDLGERNSLATVYRRPRWPPANRGASIDQGA